MIVVDSSAVIALIREERGADVLRPYVGSMVISAINFCETITVLQRLAGPDVMVTHPLSFLVSEVVAFEAQAAVEAANLHFYTKPYGLSLGDRACIALGIKRKLPIFTADKIWAELKLDADIRLIR